MIPEHRSVNWIALWMKHIESIISQCLGNGIMRLYSAVGLVCGRYVSVYKRQVPYRRVCTSRYFRQSRHAMMQLFPGRYFSTHVVARHLCSTQNSTLARWAKKGTGREMRRGYVPRRQKKMQAAISNFCVSTLLYDFMHWEDS